MTSLPSSSCSKRVTQDEQTEVPDPKRPKAIQNPKVNCLTVLIKSFEEIIEYITKLLSGDANVTTPVKDRLAILMDITLAMDITKMIYSCHKLRYREARLQSEENTEQPGREKSDFKITVSGSQIVVKQEHVMEIWESALNSVGLSYTDPKTEDQEWLETINIFFYFFLCFSLRMRELKIGLERIVLKKTGDDVFLLPISTYGLGNDHYALLEGVSFPPKIRSIMINHLGPMTAFLCMLRSRDQHRRKYEELVRESMTHIPCINEIIDITRKPNHSISEKLDIMTMSNLIAEILLRNPVAEKIAMFFPLNFLVVAATEHRTKGTLDWFLEFFSLTGSGGFYMYKTLFELQETHKFTMRSCMKEEMASQVVFHCIFGTFKEDFGVLSSITPNKNWLTRQEIGDCFNNKGPSCTDVSIKLIPFKVYAKTSPTETPVLLVTPHREYVRLPACRPCFSGRRVRLIYGPGFNDRVPKIIQIRNILHDTLSKLKEYLKNNQGTVKTWRDCESLALGIHGDEKPEFPVERNGMTFVGKYSL